MPVSSPVDRSVWEIDPLRDAFLARELEGRRFNKAQEDAWISDIAGLVKDDVRAVRPPLRHGTCDFDFPITNAS